MIKSVIIYVIIEHFSLALTAEALRAKICQNRPSLKGWVTLRLNIRLKGYVYRQHLDYTLLDGGWFCYNFADGSFQKMQSLFDLN